MRAKTFFKTGATLFVWVAALITGSIIGPLIVGPTVEKSILSRYLSDGILYLLVIMVLFLMVKIFKLEEGLHSLKQISFQIGWLPLLALIFCFAGDLFLCAKYVTTTTRLGYLAPSDLHFSGMKVLLLALCVYAGVGLSEELLCRGLLLNLWLNYYSGHKNSKIKAVALSSIFFGFIHLLNLSNGLDQPNVIYTFAQILFATMYGTFFRHYYLKQSPCFYVPSFMV